jgi:hypothetical protein
MLCLTKRLLLIGVILVGAVLVGAGCAHADCAVEEPQWRGGSWVKLRKPRPKSKSKGLGCKVLTVDDGERGEGWHREYYGDGTLRRLEHRRVGVAHGLRVTRRTVFSEWAVDIHIITECLDDGEALWSVTGMSASARACSTQPEDAPLEDAILSFERAAEPMLLPERALWLPPRYSTSEDSRVALTEQVQAPPNREPVKIPLMSPAAAAQVKAMNELARRRRAGAAFDASGARQRKKEADRLADLRARRDADARKAAAERAKAFGPRRYVTWQSQGVAGHDEARARYHYTVWQTKGGCRCKDLVVTREQFTCFEVFDRDRPLVPSLACERKVAPDGCAHVPEGDRPGDVITMAKSGGGLAAMAIEPVFAGNAQEDCGRGP